MSAEKAKARFIEFVQRYQFLDPNQFSDEMEALDALIADVQAECASKVDSVPFEVVGEGVGMVLPRNPELIRRDIKRAILRLGESDQWTE